MDSGEHPEYEYTGQETDEEMHIEASTISETILPNETEMRPPESAPSFNSIGALDTQLTPMNVSVPTSPSDNPTSAVSGEMLFTTPSIIPRRSMRRSRVEDDHDDERDRRHPSERLGSSSSSTNTSQQLDPPSSAHSVPPFTPVPVPESTNSGASYSAPSSNFRLNPFQFFRHMLPRSSNNTNPTSSNPVSRSPVNSSQRDGATAGPSGRTQTAAENAIPPPTSNDEQPPVPAPRINPRHQYLGGFTITIDVNGSMTTTPLPGTPSLPTSPSANAGQGNTQPPSGPIPGVPLAPDTQTSRENAIPAVNQQEAQTPEQPRMQPQEPRIPEDTPAPSNNTSDGTSTFADILARIGILAALSFRDSALFERDTDDPERAKKLVDGLEDVPVGLIRRLERVGKSNMDNDHGSNNESGLGDGGCAICWERLLLEAEEPKQDNINDEGKQKTPEQGNEITLNPQDLPSLHAQSDPGASSPIASLDPSTEGSEKGQQYQRIVTLPCAHVFHADCLIPWFSKPRQTTCPICRFNIDPENLTYTSRAQRAAARAQTQQQSEGGNGTDATNAVPTEADPGAGFDIPLMFAAGGGEPPIIIPLGSGPVDSNAPPASSPTNAPLPTSDAGNAGANANANRNRPPNDDVVTIGFDMYIGRGPPPFPLGGPNVFQIPVPGGPNNSVPPPLSTNVPNPATGASPNMTGNSAVDTRSLGNGPARNTDPGTGAENAQGPPGATIAIPIPIGPGFGRALGDMLTRIMSGNIPSGGNATGAGGQSGQGATTQNQAQPQGPVLFGPERPPTMLPGGIPVPGGVGFGFGGDGLGGTRVPSMNMPIPPFILPFGDRSAMTGAGAIPHQFTGGMGGSGNVGLQPGGQSAMNPGPGALPIFDIVSGLFGSRPPPSQGQGQRAPAAPNAQPPVAGAQSQPQPRRAQDAQQTPEGFGFSWFPMDLPPPRPMSVPPSRQQAPKKPWTLPLPPGLTLRERVEKREQEAGLRCCDVSCGVGPSDEDPWIHASEHGLKQLSIRASPSPATAEKMLTVDSGASLDLVEGGSEGVNEILYREKELERKSVCVHTFHSSCLVSSERVSLALRDAEVAFVGPEGRKEVEVSCPVCRSTGRMSKEDWDGGIEALS